MKRVIIIGAGGCARDVRWILEEMAARGEAFSFRGFVVSDRSKLTERDSKEDVVGELDWLEQHRDEFDALALGIGSPGPRLKISSALEPKFGPEYWPALLHPSVVLDRKSARVGHGVVMGAGVIGTVNVRIDPYALFGSACTLGHEASFGRGCVLNPTVNVSGGVRIGAGAMLGTGSQILQYLSVGEGATVGAGAVVTRDVAPGVTVVGVPAKPLRS